MPTYTASDLLSQIQTLIGEPEGGFYNVTSRLREMNRVQEEMVLECRALTAAATLTTTASTRTVSLPSDFITFSTTDIRYNDGGDYSKITLISKADADHIYPNWQDGADLYDTGTPHHAWVDNQNTLNLMPLPDGGTVVLDYVKRPADMTDFDDNPFDGNVALQRFAPGIAYKIANELTLPINPQYATILNNMYIAEIKKMRDYLRRTPQTDQRIKPRTGYGRNSLIDRIEAWRDRG